jgi:hypothetical protein
VSFLLPTLFKNTEAFGADFLEKKRKPHSYIVKLQH